MVSKKVFNKDCFKTTTNNYNNQFLSSAFLRGIAFGKNVSVFNNSSATMSIKNIDDIILAVKKAYIDMCPRTFEKNDDWWKNPQNVKIDKKGKPKNERTKDKENDWQDEKSKVFDWLARKFDTYFQKGCNDFNVWHKTICKDFLERFKPILNQYGYDADKSLKYGKAQKIVNMTFKYLFCFDDAENYAKKFDVCHMPIDSYILNWYNDSSQNKCDTAWSDLEETQYYELQDEIKKILGNYNPFLAEFYIWAEYNR